MRPRAFRSSPEFVVGQHPPHRVGNRLGLERIDEQCRVADHFGERGHIRGDDGRPARHGLERRQPEAFVERRKHEHAGESIQDRERAIGDEAEEPHVFVQLVPMDGVPQRRVLGDLVADDDELDLVELSAPPEEVEGLDGALDVLVRLDVAGVEDERVVELVALAHPRHVVLGRRLAEALVDAVVDDVDLLRRHVEVVEDVALGRLRHRQDAARLVRRRPE